MKVLVVLSSALATAAAGLNVGGVQVRDPSQDPRDFSWIQTWAAVGDSFTAGIGAGMIWDDTDDSYKCSRYDLSYVAMLNNLFGLSVQKFNYLACSGDTTLDIYKQILTLDRNQDLIVLTAGGNDLCLSTLIQKCILLSVTTEAACQSTIDQSQQFIDSQLGLNMDQLIDAAVGRLKNNGILVYNQYAKYFNDEADAPCHFDEDWVFPGQAGGTSLLLTTERRKKLNTLVDNTNKVIQQAVIAGQKRHPEATIITAAWDEWVGRNGGRFCEPGEKPDPTDPANKNCHFFKLDTTKRPAIGARGLDGMFVDNETATSGWYEQEGLEAKILSARDTYPVLNNVTLQERDPVPPSCAGGGGLALPDSVGKIFHPNELGHLAIASFVSDSISVARAKILGIKNPDCTAQSDLVCYQKQGSKSYATAYPLYAKTETFCNDAVKNIPQNTADWQYTQTYYAGSYDVTDFKVQLRNGGTSFTFDQCHRAINRILDGCDGNDPENPLNWKFGGEQDTENMVFSVRPTKQGRRMPPWKAPQSICETWYKFFFDSWDIHGGGYAGWDFGQDTILGNLTSCLGSSPTNWHFEYFDKPDENGNEWHAWGGAPIWVKSRCMSGVIKAAGGPSGVSCSGTG